MTDEKAYESPQALRQAVTDRLRALATPKGRWTLAELQRQFAYDRLLARLYVIDDSWVLKGAVALLARQVSVRHSTDIDLYRDAERTMVERELRAGAELDLGDWFRFDIGVGENLSGATGGKRYPVTAWIGATRWATFHVDLVGTGVRMTGVPDHVSSVVEISIPGIEQPGYRAYPLVDHVADVTSLVACGMPGFSHRNPVSTTRPFVASARLRASPIRACRTSGRSTWRLMTPGRRSTLSAPTVARCTSKPVPSVISARWPWWAIPAAPS